MRSSIVLAMLAAQIIAFCVLVPAALAQHQAGDLSAVTDFAILPQPADTALIAFARASGMDVVYDKSLVMQRRSPGVVGRYTVLEAIERLLAGSRLSARFVNERAVLIVDEAGTNIVDPADALTTLRLAPLEVRSKGPRLGQDPRYAAYADFVAAYLQKLFRGMRADKRLQAARLTLWIGPDGEIAQLRWLQSTGTDDADRLVESLLRSAKIPQTPPAGLPQPMRFEVDQR